MAGLLSEAEKREIRDAIRLVTDTFMVTPIHYFLGVDSIDRWNEDRADTVYNEKIVDALVEYPTNGKVKETLQGTEEEFDVTLTFNMEYLEGLNLTKTTDDDQIAAIFDADRDYFKLKGDTYKVGKVLYDGPLDAKQVLVIVTGQLYKESIMLKTI